MLSVPRQIYGHDTIRREMSNAVEMPKAGAGTDSRAVLCSSPWVRLFGKLVSVGHRTGSAAVVGVEAERSSKSFLSKA